MCTRFRQQQNSLNIRVMYPHLWFMKYISTKIQHCVYPQRKSGDMLHQSIMTLYTLRVFYLVHIRHLLTLNNWEKLVCQTLSSRMYGFWKRFYIILRRPAHIQGWATKSYSGSRQVHTSGDVIMPRIFIIRKHKLSCNLIHDIGTVFVENNS